MVGNIQNDGDKAVNQARKLFELTPQSFVDNSKLNAIRKLAMAEYYERAEALLLSQIIEKLAGRHGRFMSGDTLHIPEPKFTLKGGKL